MLSLFAALKIWEGAFLLPNLFPKPLRSQHKLIDIIKTYQEHFDTRLGFLWFHVILISIKFGQLLLWFSPRIINELRSYIKHLKECFILHVYPNSLKSVINKDSAAPHFFNPLLFSVLGYWMTDLCLIYYFLPVFLNLHF
jgi:hypothetical protein